MKEELRKAMEEERARVQLCAAKSAKATVYFFRVESITAK